MIYFFFYAITLSIATIYSYVLLDTSITFFNNPAWTAFRNAAIQIGYFQRPLSGAIFVGIVLVLTALHVLVLKKAPKTLSPLKLSFLIGGVLFFSYPFLSHDFFNYMFDAKILTYYHQNPYMHAAWDFPADPWLRFMHWIHRPYPYGPVFLGITIVPAFFGAGKFVIHFFLLKLVCVMFYIASVFYASKIKREYGLWLATQPLFIIEGLISGHNEVMAVGLGMIGLYFLVQKHQVLPRVLLLASAGIKFMSFPFVCVTASKKFRILNYVSLFLMCGVLYYACFRVLPQQWYFLNLFFYLPVFPNLLKRMQIFFMGIVLSYYPYMAIDGWISHNSIDMKNQIIAGSLMLNGLYLVYVMVIEKKGWRFLLHEALSESEHTKS